MRRFPGHDAHSRTAAETRYDSSAATSAQRIAAAADKGRVRNQSLACWHITLSSARRMPLFPTETLRRAAVRCVARICGASLLLFNIVDDHVHVVVLCTAEKAGRLAGGLWRALRCIAAASVDPPHRRPVEGRAHLRWLVRYLLTQTTHHGIDVHPVLWTGSSFADLIGARVLPCFDGTAIRHALPRLQTTELCQMVGIRADAITPYGDSAIRSLGAVRLAEAAAAAVAAGPSLAGHTLPVVTARRVAAHLGLGAGIQTVDVAWALGVTPRAARRLAADRVDERFLRAARVHLSLEGFAHRLPTQAAG